MWGCRISRSLKISHSTINIQKRNDNDWIKFQFRGHLKRLKIAESRWVIYFLHYKQDELKQIPHNYPRFAEKRSKIVDQIAWVKKTLHFFLHIDDKTVDDYWHFAKYILTCANFAAKFVWLPILWWCFWPKSLHGTFEHFLMRVGSCTFISYRWSENERKWRKRLTEWYD